MAMNWNMLMSDARYHEDSADTAECGEVTYENDYDTIISSTLFRRLQDKAQVFPLEEDDYVRTRLTHSLEVSAIGKNSESMYSESYVMPVRMSGLIRIRKRFF